MIASSGCMVNYYHRKGAVTSLTFGVLVNDNLRKLTIDRNAKTTSTGFAADGVNVEVDNEAVGAVTKGVVEGVIEGLKHL